MTSSHSSNLTLPALVTWYHDLTKDRLDFASYNRLIHTFHSTTIDGGSLTILETKALLEEGSTTVNKPVFHQLMLLDYQEAQQLTLAWAAEREPLNRDRLQTIGAALMRRTGGTMHTILGSFDSRQGEFRRVSAMTRSRQLMDAMKVPAAVDKLVKHINTKLPVASTIRQIYDLSSAL